MLYGGLAELVDALDLGSSVERRAGSSPVSPTMLSGLCNFNRMNPVIKALGAGERTGALCKGKSSNCTLKAQKSGRGRFIGSCA